MTKIILGIIILLALIPLCNIFAENGIDLYIKSVNSYTEDESDDKLYYLLELSRDNPENGNYHFSLGYLYYNNGDYHNSIKAFQNAQNLGWYYDSSFMLAKNFALINKPESAIHYLKQYIASPFKGPVIDAGLADSVFISLHGLPQFQKLLKPELTEDSIENWLNEIDYMSHMFKITHYDPFGTMSEKQWDRYISQLKSDIPNLNTDQILMRIYRFIAMIGDAHTTVIGLNKDEHKFPAKRLPFQISMFSDGCYITSVPDMHKELIGAKIEGVNDTGYSELQSDISTLIPSDNEKWYNTLFYKYITNANLLHGLGISNSVDSLEIVYSQSNKTYRKKVFSVQENSLPEMTEFHDINKSKEPMFLQNKDNHYWSNYNAEEGILYFQFNQVISIKERPLEAFCDSLRNFVSHNEVSAFVLDLRNNTGGNSENNKTILKLLTTDEVNIFGQLFVLIGNTTFSAAQNLSCDLENYTEAIFLGNHTGSKPNFIGEVNYFQLPYSRLTVSSSNLYHQRGKYSADRRKWIAPDVYIYFSFEDYKNGYDPVMNEISDYLMKNKRKKG